MALPSRSRAVGAARATLAGATALTLAALAAPAARAQAAGEYTFATFSLPNTFGAGSLSPNGIDNAGNVVGTFSLLPLGEGSRGTRGFSGSPAAGDRSVPITFRAFDVPGTNLTRAAGLNDAGQIVGTAFLSGRERGFVLDGATVTVFDGPAPPTVRFSDTYATDINSAGQVVGYYEDEVFFGVPFPRDRGFVRDAGGAFVTLNVPGAENTRATGINDAGDVAGYTFGGTSGLRGFVRTVGGTEVFAFPDPSAASGSAVTGINNLGQVVGVLVTPTGCTRRSFVRTGGTFAFLQVPSAAGTTGCTLTEAYGINDAGQVVGTYYDAAIDRRRAFVATPVAAAVVPEPGTWALVGAGLAALGSLGARRRRRPA